MIERRQYKRTTVDYWASLKHPLAGTFTARVENMSAGGISLVVDEKAYFFVMMELEVRIHGDGWDESMPGLPAQVMRIDGSRIALKFLETCEGFWPPREDEFTLLWGELGDMVQRV